MLCQNVISIFYLRVGGVVLSTCLSVEFEFIIQQASVYSVTNQCFNCNGVPAQEDCDVLIQCGENEASQPLNYST